MIKTRFAPSPTGFLHIGGARTALFSHLFALHHGGKNVLRIEDTDQERSTQEAIDAIIESLNWLGLHYDEGPYFQTERFDRYKEMIQVLLKKEEAYYCYCSHEELEEMRREAEARKEKPRYNGKWRPEPGKVLPNIPDNVSPVVRFKNPLAGVTAFNDLIHGRIAFDNTELDDLIIARSDGTPTYNFCVVVDDMDMGITHVIRGDDHINNTPRQINIFKAFGATVPQYGHVAMILGDDGQKLSKRHGAVSVMEYYEQGFLSEAIINYLIRLGWAHGDQEIFSHKEMVKLFDLNHVSKSASAFNTSKLLWLNQHYMKTMPEKDLAMKLSPFLQKRGVDFIDMTFLAQAIIPHVPRAQTLVELADMLLYLFQKDVEYDKKAVEKQLTSQSKPVLRALYLAFQKLEKWKHSTLNDAIKEVMTTLDVGMGKIGMPLRTAIVGRTNSPNLDETLYLVGKKRTLERLEKALTIIDEE